MTTPRLQLLVTQERHWKDDDVRSMGYCTRHGDYSGRLLRCPVCQRAQQEMCYQLLWDFAQRAKREGWCKYGQFLKLSQQVEAGR